MGNNCEKLCAEKGAALPAAAAICATGKSKISPVTWQRRIFHRLRSKDDRHASVTARGSGSGCRDLRRLGF